MKTLLKTIIVDDEAASRRWLKRHLKQAGDFEILAEASKGGEALNAIRKHAPDMVFLDVQMPGMDGFDVLRALPPDRVPVIVFVTAFDDYAVQAFGKHGLDYLLKPIDDDRFAEVLGRARRNCGPKHVAKHRKSLQGLVRQITGPSSRESRQTPTFRSKRSKGNSGPRLAIRDGGQTTWVRQDEIEWIDAAGDYMCVHAGGETHIMRKTMKSLERELDPSILQRIHRSTIVNIGQVKDMQAHINGEYFLTLMRGHIVKLSRSYRNKLRFFDKPGIRRLPN